MRFLREGHSMAIGVEYGMKRGGRSPAESFGAPIAAEVSERAIHQSFERDQPKLNLLRVDQPWVAFQGSRLAGYPVSTCLGDCQVDAAQADVPFGHEHECSISQCGERGESPALEQR